MPYLIHGATGAQGSPLFERLLANGSNAVAAVRDPTQLGPKPAIAIDMGSDSLAAAYRHADGVFVHLPMGPESMRVQYARNIVDAVRAGKPKRVVISTSGNHVDLDAEGQPGDTAIAMLVRGIQAADRPRGGGGGAPLRAGRTAAKPRDLPRRECAAIARHRPAQHDAVAGPGHGVT